MDRKLKAIIFVYPFVFALHNLEEVLGMMFWRPPEMFNVPYSPQQFAMVAGLITVIGFVIFFAKGLYPSERHYLFIVSGFVGTMFLNVIFPHLLAVIHFGKYVPGVITAVVFILPLSGYFLLLVYKSGIFTIKRIVFSVTLISILGIGIIFLFLYLASRIMSL